MDKDGVKVAVLTFTKSAYRLGETVICIVDANERLGRLRVPGVSLMIACETGGACAASCTLDFPSDNLHSPGLHFEIELEHERSYVNPLLYH